MGLAQIKRLHEFLAIQKRNHHALKKILEQIPGIQFRRLPDPEGDSCTFLSWFLPTEEITIKLVEALKAEAKTKAQAHVQNIMAEAQLNAKQEAAVSGV